MGLSDASWFAATVAILLGIYIGERILDIDFSVFLAKNRKKGKIKRMMEQRGDTTLQKSGILSFWLWYYRRISPQSGSADHPAG